MKKTLFSLAAIALVATSCKTGPDRAALKKKFTDECKATAMKDLGTMQGMESLVDEYCSCSGDKVLDNFTNEELAAWGNKPESMPQERIMTITKPCLDEFTQKVQAKFAGQ